MDLYKCFKKGMNLLSWNITIEKLPKDFKIPECHKDEKLFIFSHEVDNYNNLKSFIIVNIRTSRAIKFYKERNAIEVDKDTLFFLRADMDIVINQMNNCNFGYAKNHAISIRDKISKLI
jgi:hypothetical protein